MLRIIASRAAALAFLFAVAACRDATEPAVATTIELSDASLTFDALGDTRTLTAIVKDQHGDPMPNAAVSWSSSSPAVTVVASGTSTTVISAANGSATITAAAGPANATLVVQVSQVAASLMKVSGDGQRGAAGTILAAPLEVRVGDRLGAAMSGVSVSFTVTAGNGTVSGASAISGVDGKASVTYTLGRSASQSQEVSVTLGTTASARFVATAIAGAPAIVRAARGDNQTAQVATQLPVAPAALVTDQYDNPVSGVVVAYATAHGSIADASAVSGADGVAALGSWTMPTTAGGKTLTASVNGLPSFTFVATATAGPAAAAAATAGNGQTAPPGTSVVIRPAVRVADAFGNGVAGLSVSFAVTSGSGSVTGATQMTDQTGVASVGSWTLGSGANSLAATVVGASIPSVVFNATGSNSSPAATISVVAGTNQAALQGTALPEAPSVIVRDAGGNPVGGVSVAFAVTSGGGSIANSVRTTGADGIATAGAWTVGTAGPNTATATVAATGASTSFTSFGCSGAGAGYQITVCYLTSMTTSQRAAFDNSAARWRGLIVGDVPDTPITLGAGSCGDSPRISMTIDDLLIFAAVSPIDGPSGILGQAGWCIQRSGGLPLLGLMQFDVADVAGLEASNRFGTVILHEMGHVLGIGTMWSSLGLLQNPSVPGVPADTYFSGTNALLGFNNIGGGTYTGGQRVPVENGGGLGTINSHWRESVLANELMTGFVNVGSNPLSELTVRSLADLGYLVNPAGADPFSIAPALFNKVGDDEGVPLGNDVLSVPGYSIDTRGRIIRIR